jgi:hypothetical protein
MFEKDGRKQQREKRQAETNSPRARGLTKKTDTELPQFSPRPQQPHHEISNNNNSSTIYGELKLSEKLAIEIAKVREEKDQMLEKIEYLEIEYAKIQKEKKSMELSFNKNRNKISEYKELIQV